MERITITEDSGGSSGIGGGIEEVDAEVTPCKVFIENDLGSISMSHNQVRSHHFSGYRAVSGGILRPLHGNYPSFSL
ncbi:MAG: hypothetical protein A4E62_03070 [Syntrophorhabdus sp. PtaU1.Bin002]|nr:MAG: hypothetical protein A4E62_03070 [Syntrophorhabdus sp. PtaU1.Bin002]